MNSISTRRAWQVTHWMGSLGTQAIPAGLTGCSKFSYYSFNCKRQLQAGILVKIIETAAAAVRLCRQNGSWPAGDSDCINANLHLLDAVTIQAGVPWHHVH